MRSYVLANDKVMITLDERARIREIYHPLPGGPGWSLGRAAGIGLVVAGLPLLLEEAFDCRNEPLRGDLVARQHLRSERLELDIEVETFVLDDRDLVGRVFRFAGRPGLEFDLVLHLDLAIEGHDYGDGVRAESGGVLHWKGRSALLHRFEGPGEDAGWTLGRRDREDGVIGKLRRAGLDRDPCAVGAGESLIARHLRLDGQGRAEARSVMLFLDGPDAVVGLPAELFDRPLPERRHMPRRAPPPALDRRLADVFDNSLAHLAATFASSSGALIASPDTEGLDLAREHYGYVWPRDAALLASTMIRLGLGALCDPFLDFCARHRHPDGWFHQRLRADGAPASTWHPRRPEDPRLLPIQSDETALVVLAAAERVLDGGDRRHFERLVEPCCRFLLAYRDEKTGLPLPSHDLWEERFGVHTFTVCTTLAALRRAAAAASALGETRADWEAGARSLHRALLQTLHHRDLGRFARRGETRPDGTFWLDTTVDSALAALFLFDLGGGLDEPVAGTMAAVEERLLLKVGVGGVARYEDDHYHRRGLDPQRIPGNPWIIGTLWLARWRLRRGDRAGALTLLDQVLGLADPSGALPEQVHPLTGRSLSVQPLAWSHAALLDLLLDLGKA